MISSRKSARIPAAQQHRSAAAATLMTLAWLKKRRKKKASGHNTAVHSNIFKYLEVESRFPTQILTDKELFQVLNCAGFTNHPLLSSFFNFKSCVEDIFKSCVVKLVLTAMHHMEHHLPVGVSEV